MSFNYEDIKSAALKSSLIQECELINKDIVRMPTGFMYPDGSFIDVFVRSEADHPGFCLSDMGQTAAYLADLHIYIYKNRKRRLLAENICKTLDVDDQNGELLISVHDISEMENAVIRLSQACIRISDVCFSRLAGGALSYKENVEAFLDAGSLVYTRDIVLTGKYEREIGIDFEVIGKRGASLVVTLSTLNPASSHTMANEAFRRWYDLEPHRREYSFLTLYDSSNDCIREDDIMRLNEISAVFAFPAEASSVYEVLAV